MPDTEPLFPGQDHPRLRGEQRMLGGRDPQQMGSPPLARGTAAPAAPSIVTSGITPACAGNSAGPVLVGFRCRDHPRLRGEQLLGTFDLSEIWGSPPLARGTVAYARGRPRASGITPACAGNRNKRYVMVW